MQTVQPKIKGLQKKHKDDKEALAKATMDLYKSEKVNPAAGCLPLIIQIVFLIAIYQVIIAISKADFVIVGGDLYSFVINPGTVSHLFLGLVDLAHPNIFLTAIAALALFYQTKMMLPTMPAPTPGDEPDFTSIMTKQMLYIGPLLTLMIGATLPAGLSLYWLSSTLVTIYQQKRRITNTLPSA